MPTKKVIKKSVLSPTILIAGGAGFIGSSLAEKFLEKDARVIVIDNFKTGKRSYVDRLLKNPKFALYDADINAGLPEEFQSVDYVLHLASLEEYKDDTNVTLESLLTNAVGTKNLLDFATRSEAKFVLASSIYVYQGMMSQLHLDSYFGSTPQDQNKYSMNEAKRYAEALVWEYYKKNDADVRIVRLPEVYGPGMDLGSSGELGRLVNSLVENKDLVIYGDGTEKEYYLYITDAVNGVIKSLFNDRTKGRIYSLVNSEPYSPLEIAYLLKSVANRELKIEFKPTISAPLPKRVAPDTASLRDLDWEVKTHLKEGLLKVVESLGYETNEFPFKPAKLIAEKNKEKKMQKGELVTSLVGDNDAPLVPEFTPQPVVWKEPEKPIKNGFNGGSFYKPVDSQSEKVLSVSPKLQRKYGLFSKKNIVPAIFSVLLLTLLLTIVPAVQTYINVKSAYSDATKVPSLLGQLSIEEAKKTAESSFTHLLKAQNSFQKLRWVFVATGQEDRYNSALRLMSSATYSSKAAYFLSKSAEPVKELWESVRPNSEKVMNNEVLEKAKSDFSQAKTSLELAHADMQQVDVAKFPSSIKPQVEEYRNFLNVAYSNTDLMSASLLGLSDLIGVDSSKKYLILFQNNNEIRPTGGFIGSYALLEMEKGKIKSLIIDDIYNPDGQLDLKGYKEEPPAPIAELLKEETMHIRNANWDPDFPKSAAKIQELYFEVTGNKTDGVVAIDLNFAQSLLKVTGPIFLTAYNEEISAENLYERAQYHSEFNYRNGSDQKRSFLTVLGSKLLEKMFALPKDEMAVFWSELGSALDGRHLLVYLNSNPLGAYFEKKGWDGSLVHAENDYLQVVNANLGGTKANYFVKNSYDYKVLTETRDGLLRGALTLKYEHTGESSAWPGGPYTDYVRVLVQDGSKLTGAKIKYSGQEEKDIFEEIAVSEEGQYTSFVTSFVLEPKQSVEISIFYDLPTRLTLSRERMNYQLYWQKQAGTFGDKFNFTFNEPFSLKAAPSTLTGDLNKDQKIFVTLDPL